MVHLPWLEADDPFPPPGQALTEPAGLLAAGADLSPARLVSAYRQGIFPWYNEGEPVLWWSPDPRGVIFPEQFDASRSLRQQRRRSGWMLAVDRDFDAVLAGCAGPRAGAGGTWISPDMQAAYRQLHDLGLAHCIAVYRHGTLVGGLYGVNCGGLFCGEYMFSHASDASKLAFWALMRLAVRWQWPVLDCQLPNPHLLSLGATTIPRTRYLSFVTRLVEQPAPQCNHAEALLREEGFPVMSQGTGS